MAPRSGRRVEHADLVRDVHADAERRVGETPVGLLHPHDVGAALELLAVEVGVLLELPDADPVEEQPFDEPVRLGVAPLALAERDHVRLGELVHPVVRHVEGRIAARRPRSAGDAAPVDLELVVRQLLAVRDVERERRAGDDVLDRPRAEPAAHVRDRRAGNAAVGVVRLVAHLDRGAVQPDELRVHRRVERTPVVPALGDGRARDDAAGADARSGRRAGVRAPVVDRPRDRVALRVHRRLVRVDARLVPLEPEVVVDPGVVRLRRRLDQRRRHVAVLVEELRREPLLDPLDRVLRLRLRLRQEIAVEIEVVPVGPLVEDVAVRVLHHVEDRDRVVEDRVHLGIGPVGRGREPLDEHHVRVDALGLVSVDRALDEDRDLEVVPVDAKQPLGEPRTAQCVLADLLPVVVVAPLLVRLQRVDHDLVHVVAERRLAGHPVGHAAVRLRLDLVERAGDRIPRNVRVAPDRIRRAGAVRQRRRSVGNRCSAPGRADDRPIPRGSDYERRDERRKENRRQISEPACHRHPLPQCPGRSRPVGPSGRSGHVIPTPEPPTRSSHPDGRLGLRVAK